MKLVKFSVKNYRSITKAHNLEIAESTILIGQNNEGKSNVLHALTTAMQLIRKNALLTTTTKSMVSPTVYDWERDFPIQLQEENSKKKTVFNVEFELVEDEIQEFWDAIKSTLNGILPIEITIGQDRIPKFKVLKKGPGGTALSGKSSKIAKFIGEKISLKYIPAVRTSSAAVQVVTQMLDEELATIEGNEDYKSAMEKIRELQEPILNRISKQITDPLKQFIPQIKDVTIKISQRERFKALRRSCEVIIDDGTPTLLQRKGDGVKSLAAISLLMGKTEKNRASILALEEPESHLHPAAIHRLKSVIEELSAEHQVILTTHCPLFVDRNNISTNIIISANKAKPAKYISEIRDVLGVKASDNLMHASLVLIVEGSDDKKSLEALFSHFSQPLKKALRDGNLVIDPCGGASNLDYKLSTYQATLCMTHVFFDYDSAGREAVEQSESSGNLKISEYQHTICNGTLEAEFEDCLDVSIYEEVISDKFGVDITIPTFRGNKKWSERMKSTFLVHGKVWTDTMKKKVKLAVSECVAINPADALNEHKRTSVDALIIALEKRL